MRSRALLVPLLALAAVVGTIWMFGSDGSTTDDEALVGAWNSEARALQLASDGTYALLVHGTGAEAGLECGRWRAFDAQVGRSPTGPTSVGAQRRSEEERGEAMTGTFQMRVDEARATSISIATMREPRLRAGRYAREGDRLGFDLRDGSGAKSAWIFTRGGVTIDCTSP